MEELNKKPIEVTEEEIKEAEEVIKNTIDANSDEVLEENAINEELSEATDEASENFDNLFNEEELPNFSELFGSLFGGAGGPLEEPILTVEKIDKTAELPKYAHPGDAGMDVCSNEDIEIYEHDWALVHTGIKVAVPEGFEMQVRPRSGLALKHGITVLNTPGTIDSGYRGEVGVILMNNDFKTFKIKKGDRIAQLVIAPVISVRVVEGDVNKTTERGEGGFGSTGVNTENDKTN
jgi:dUTP pyrophosphatase